MSCSTHAGFNAPPAACASPGVLRSNSDGDVPVSLKSRAAGVGLADPCVIATAHPGLFGVSRPSPEHINDVSDDAFAAFGVGHRESFAATASGIPAPLPFECFALSASALASHDAGSSASLCSPAKGVGHITCAASDA